MSEAGGTRAGLALLVLTIAVYGVGLRALPPIDRDEARFAQASRQMFEAVSLPASDLQIVRDDVGRPIGGPHAGGAIVPMVGERPRINKPPVIYWLQAASAWTLTLGRPALDAIWMYRVPSALAAIIAVLATWRLGCAMGSARAGALAAAMLAVCPVVAWEAHQARADMVLLACTTLAMRGLWEVWRAGIDGRRAGAWGAAMWAAIAIGTLTKGPVTPMVVLLTAVVVAIVTRRARWLVAPRAVLGLALMLAIATPWALAVSRHPLVGPAGYWQTVYHEVIGRSASAREGHWGPPGYHLALVMVLFWPGSMLLVPGLVRGWRRARRRAPAELFCLAWIVPAWVVFELVGTKLPHYTLPMYPALALLTARGVVAISRAVSQRAARGPVALGPLRHGVRAGWIIGIVLTLTGAVGGIAAGLLDGGGARAALGTALALAGLWLVISSARAASRGARVLRAQGLLIASAAATSIAIIGLVLPASSAPWISTRLAREIERIDPEGSRPLGALGFHEDSLVFLTRARVRRLADDEPGKWMRDNPGWLLILPRDRVTRQMSVRAEVSGFNYSRGRWAELAVVQHFMDTR